MTTTSITLIVHTVERTVRIFVHSDFSACASVVFCTGIGDVYCWAYV
ncbi:hypothetical protein [Streptomyces sp. SPB162]|nr:hypothetical protein [Streptomyces sp. SPB162]